MVFGGLMGQGQSNAGRVTMAGAALDPLAELWVYVFAANGDYDAYAPRLARYHKGVGTTSPRLRSTGCARCTARWIGAKLGSPNSERRRSRGRWLVAQHPDLRPCGCREPCHGL
jgi:S-DNA-T family DNA segregation ATPase FtsK/SpoIIIE